MQKRSHRLLASALLESCSGFSARRYEAAFLFGSFQPDCNPLSYLKGSRTARFLRGHNYDNSRAYLFSHIARLQARQNWTVWHYYTLGKLTHYLADAFTFPHNSTYHDSLRAHRRYEAQLRLDLAEALRDHAFASQDLREDLAEVLREYVSAHQELHQELRQMLRQDLTDALIRLHERYLSSASTLRRDIDYICLANQWLMSACLPAVR